MARFSGAALLVIVALGVTPSSALRCWVCNSENDNRCGDPFQKYEENFYLDCSNILTTPPRGNDYSAHRMVCVKTTRRIDSYRTLVHRSCEWGHVSNLQQSACSARENNPFFQNSYAGGGYPQAQVGYPQSYPGAGGYAGSNYPPGGYNQGGYRGYQQGGYQQGGYQQGGYGQNYPRNDYGGSYGQQGSYGGGGYGGSGGYVSGYSGSYGSGYGHDYCVVCSTDGCNSAPHGVVVTPLTALAALLAPIATWLFARR